MSAIYRRKFGYGGKEMAFKLEGLSMTLRGKSWGNPNVSEDKRILAWPGWLDNCGSWFSTGPLMASKGYYMVAIDPVGCGISDHFSPTSLYCEAEEALHIMLVAKSLNWTKPFILLGHSRGSNVVSTTAAVFRHLIRAVLVVEGPLTDNGAFLGSYEESKSDLEPHFNSFRILYLENRKRAERKVRKFKDFDEAVLHSYKNPMFPKSLETATNIVARHVRPLTRFDGKFTEKFVFTHDARTYGQPSVSPLYPRAVHYVKTKVACPVLMLMNRKNSARVPPDREHYVNSFINHVYAKKENIEKSFEFYKERINNIQDLSYKRIEGTHHLHSDIPEVCVPVYDEFLTKKLPEFKPIEAFPDYHADCFDEYKELLLIPDETSSENISLQLVPLRKQEMIIDGFNIKIGVVVYGAVNANTKLVCVCDDQDNAASFELFASRLVDSDKNICVICFDKLGQGATSPKDDDQAYNQQEDGLVLLTVADYFNFSKFHIISHCRGTIQAMLVARWFPERVSSIVVISAFTETSEPLAKINEFIASDMVHSLSEIIEDSIPRLPRKRYYRSVATENLMELRSKKLGYKSRRREDVRQVIGIAEEWSERVLSRVRCPVEVICPENKQTLELKRKFHSSKASDLLIRSVELKEKEKKYLRKKALVTYRRLQGSRYCHIDNVSQVVKIVKESLEKSHTVVARL